MARVTFQPSGLALEIDETTTLREAAHIAGIDIGDRCGGMGACCNCVITVLDGAENINEKNNLEAAVFYLDAKDRLSCQCRITGDVIVKPWNAG